MAVIFIILSLLQADEIQNRLFNQDGVQRGSIQYMKRRDIKMIAYVDNNYTLLQSTGNRLLTTRYDQSTILKVVSITSDIS